MATSDQLDFSDIAEQTTQSYRWVCSCGKSSVFTHGRKRAGRRARGHEVQCLDNGRTELEVVTDADD